MQRRGRRAFRARGALKAIAAATLCLAAAACDRERRDYDPRPFAETAPQLVEVSQLRPAGMPAPAPDPRAKIYNNSAWHISQGQRLFNWFNCSGCHANGGGSIGPSLMDDRWRYGGSMEDIYASISEGRPNGMPAWREKIPAAQIWELAAYVRSLSGNAPSAAEGSRQEAMASIPAQDLMHPTPAPKPGLASQQP